MKDLCILLFVAKEDPPMRPLFYNALILMTFALPSQAFEDEAIISFNAKEYPSAALGQRKAPLQEVTLLACNTKKNIKISWDEDKQHYDVPYGEVDPGAKDGYFVSKYYLASPPVFTPDKKAILGQLIPDYFTFHDDGIGRKSKSKFYKNVGVTYSVLPPVSLGEIKTDFNYTNKDGYESCERQGVSLVPINIECDDFPRLNGRYGASGIGFLESTKPYNKIFIPKYGDALNNALNCTATILDDIVLKHSITFSNGTKTVNMTGLYYDQEPMQFVCERRRVNDIPAGCRVPDETYSDQN
jgi:hypothetical protein